MKKMTLLVLCILVVRISHALTDTVDGVTWHYVSDGNNAKIRSPNIDSLQSVDTYSLLPAHEGSLPRILRIPEKLGGLTVYAIEMGAIQLSDNSGVELIIVPSTVHGVSEDAIIGQYVRWESGSYHNHRYHYRWIFKNAREYGLRGVLYLGDTDYRYNRDWEWIYIPAASSEIVFSSQDGGGLLPQLYFVEGVKDIGGYVDLLYGAAKVEIAPKAKLFNGTTSVTLTCTNNTAKILYTLDGSDPTTNQTENCSLYEGPISITHRTQVKALAYVAEYPYQVVYSNEYALGQTLAPTISAQENVFNWSGNVVTLSCVTEGAEIRYTLDGSEPTESSRLYTGPFMIDDTTTVKAKAFKEDWFESETATATFTREWYTVDAPVIEPSGAEFANISQTVSLSCATDGATILYTTDGSDPKVNGREYTKPFTIYKSCTVRAIAGKHDWKDSAETTATFTRSESLSEAANLYGYTMETDSAAPWTVDAAVSHDGVSSVRSGAIGNNGTTYLMASVKKAGTVSFWWKAQCEEPDEEDGEDGYYDYGVFLVDDAVKARIAGNDTGWRFVSVEVPTGGKHVLRWEYRKDGATSYAPDCVWVDQVQWSPADGSGYTLTSPEPVPYSWLSQYGLGVASGDFEAAANAASGKTQGGAATSVWEEFVAGTDPTNALSVFTAMIEMQGDTPVVTWEPDLNTNGVIRTYKVYGSETLDGGGEWQYPTNSLHRFFKVSVEMP